MADYASTDKSEDEAQYTSAGFRALAEQIGLRDEWRGVVNDPSIRVILAALKIAEERTRSDDG